VWRALADFADQRFTQCRWIEPSIGKRGSARPQVNSAIVLARAQVTADLFVDGFQ
jgi:hypothetical protein